MALVEQEAEAEAEAAGWVSAGGCPPTPVRLPVRGTEPYQVGGAACGVVERRLSQERERERETDRQTDRQTQTDMD